MKISFDWLKNYVTIDIPSKELANKLTMAGLEVESVEYLGEKYENFFVGLVQEVNKHPNADKLTVCQVDVGNQILEIVCGAPNVASGQKVPVGLVGAVVPQNQHDPEGKPFVLERVRIRGVESNGMICSEFELGLGDDAKGILVLDTAARVGQPLAEYLGLTQTIYEIGLTPNRPDCMSHLGIAREVAALLGKKLKKPSSILKESNERIQKWASVQVDNLEDCPRYTARVIRGVRVAPSPEWLQSVLKSVGMRPINNVVDITNYVLLELGHPLHEFDYDKLADGHIVVRRANEGDSFITLDGKERELRTDTLMICDAKQPVAVAGVMGGANTEISDSTANVLLESAYFNPRSIRRTSKYLGLSTDASQRFERGADPNATRFAIDRAVQLICDVCGGEILKGVIDIYPRKLHSRVVPLRVGRANEVLGSSLTEKEIIQMLSSLEIPITRKVAGKTGKKLLFVVPTFRPDLEREIDLFEEVARLHRYDNIETKNSTVLKFSSIPVPVDLSDDVRDFLQAEGYREVVTNSLQERSVASLGGGRYVEILNPISKDMAALRTSLIPGMLSVVQHNLNHGIKNLQLFEVGKVFRRGSEREKGEYFDDFVEEERLLLTSTGLAKAPGWDRDERTADFFDVKGVLERLLSKILLDKFRLIYYSTSSTLTEFSVGVEFNGSYVGFLGKLRDDIALSFAIEQDVYVAEISVEVLKKIERRKPAFRPLPKYPSVTRDLAFVVDEDVSIAQIEESIRESAGKLLMSARLFDVYVGDQVERGKKSCAFSLEFLSLERTLTEEEVDKVVHSIVQFVGQKLGAKLRS